MKTIVFRLSLFFLCSALTVSLPHVATAQEDTHNRPKIGLVLGGGGAKGAAHIGVLKVLEEQHIPIDCIAGTSMGAIVGSLYASGLSAAEIEKTLTSVDWKDLFTDRPDRRDIDFRRKQEDYQILTKLELGLGKGGFRLPKGIIGAQKVNVLFETLMIHVSDIKDFDKLPIPFRAVAADIETGEMVVIRSGSLADAARASMSVPGVFPPVVVDGHYVVDGGIVRNLPVDIVREMGADVIIAVDVGKPLLKRDKLGSALSVMGQMLDIMIKKNVQEQIATLGEKDVFIRPELGDIESGDFNRGAEAAKLGEQAARTHIGSLARYSVSKEAYADFLAMHHRNLVTSVKVASVKVEGTERVSPETVASRIETKPGETVPVAQLDRDVNRVYGLGDFERVDLKIRKREDAYDVIVRAIEKSWGPNYFRIGLALDSDFKGDSNFYILADYTMRWLNSLGAEWKNQVQIGSTMFVFSEFYQPLTYSRLFFVAPHAEWKQWPVDIYDGNKRVAQYRVKTLEGGLDLGIQPWTYGEARLGLAWTRLRADSSIGNVDLPGNNFTRGAVVFKLIADQIDNVNFPHHGYNARLTSISALKGLGSDDAYNKVEGIFNAAYTYKRQTFLAGLRVGTHIGQELPFYDPFSLGGFLSLSGLHPYQLLGQYVGLARIITYHKLSESLIGDLYLGGSIETGNAWKKGDAFALNKFRLAGSIFLGYDTILGPLYFAYGHADGGNNAVYFYLGRTF